MRTILRTLRSRASKGWVAARRRIEVATTAKVFGIGFPRTGTTTLHEALKLLGYASQHCAPQAWDDLDAPVFRRCTAFSDLPFPIMYERLDVRFPGSRFVLTIRDTDEWLESCRWLFEIGDWPEDIHRMHRLTYGRTTFDEQAMRERYVRHNRSVLEYFEGRSDLLVVDFTRDAGWETLCPFLGKAPPAEPFPHANRRGTWGL